MLHMNFFCYISVYVIDNKLSIRMPQMTQRPLASTIQQTSSYPHKMLDSTIYICMILYETMT